MAEVGIVLLLCVFYLGMSCAEDLSQDKCTIASLRFNSIICQYIVPSLLGLLVILLITTIILACKLSTNRKLRKQQTNEMTISDVLPYGSSPNIHTIGTGTPHICDATATAIEIKPPAQSVAVEHTIPSSSSFIGEIDSVTPQSKSAMLVPTPSQSAPKTTPKNQASKPQSIYMSLKRFIPTKQTTSRPTLAALRNNRRNSRDYVAMGQTSSGCYDDTVVRTVPVGPDSDSSDGYINMSEVKNCKSQYCETTHESATLDVDNNFAKPKKSHSVISGFKPNGTEEKAREQDKVKATEKEKANLMRDYVNISPSNSNDSAANCSYAFPQLRAFPLKLWTLRKAKFSLPSAASDV